jgi:hypothetical protein
MPAPPAMHRRPAVFGEVHAHDTCSEQSAGKIQNWGATHLIADPLWKETRRQNLRATSLPMWIDHEALRLTCDNP